jgi:2-keto-4-pentenoate hydratase
MQAGEKIVTASPQGIDSIVDAFREARLTNTALAGFPGPIPQKIADSYNIQTAAIAAWPDLVRGWKVGRILGDLVDVHGTDRLIGPIFSRHVQWAKGDEPLSFTAIDGGFCAVEPELVFKLGHDAPVIGGQINAEQALALVKDVLVGIEIAGSPLATINALGPCVVVSDFGNNAGLILGPPLLDWRNRLGFVEASTWIDGQHVGTGTDAAFPGGITQSLVFALNQAARMGLPMKAGALVSTGAISGVHSISAGQSACCCFGDEAVINARCIAAQSRASL